MWRQYDHIDLRVRLAEARRSTRRSGGEQGGQVLFLVHLKAGSDLLCTACKNERCLAITFHSVWRSRSFLAPPLKLR